MQPRRALNVGRESISLGDVMKVVEDEGYLWPIGSHSLRL